MVDENKNTVDASQVKPDITVEFGEPDMDRILLNAYRDLAAADESGDEGAKLQAYRKLQKLLIDQETIGEKALIYTESGAAGANKGILQTFGFPVDVANLLIGLGETGVRKALMKQVLIYLLP